MSSFVTADHLQEAFEHVFMISVYNSDCKICMEMTYFEFWYLLWNLGRFFDWHGFVTQTWQPVKKSFCFIFFIWIIYILNSVLVF